MREFTPHTCNIALSDIAIIYHNFELLQKISSVYQNIGKKKYCEFIFFLISLLLLLPLVGLAMILPQYFLVFLSLAIIVLVLVSVLASAIGGIFRATVYQFAVKGQQAQGFDSELLANAVK